MLCVIFGVKAGRGLCTGDGGPGESEYLPLRALRAIGEIGEKSSDSSSAVEPFVSDALFALTDMRLISLSVFSKRVNWALCFCSWRCSASWNAARSLSICFTRDRKSVV